VGRIVVSEELEILEWEEAGSLAWEEQEGSSLSPKKVSKDPKVGMIWRSTRQRPQSWLQWEGAGLAHRRDRDRQDSHILCR
jgi:hypothetical protein